jgi:hypothetical protein
MNETRRTHVDQEIELLRCLSNRLLGLNFASARREREALEQRLVKLRKERRILNAPLGAAMTGDQHDDRSGILLPACRLCDAWMRKSGRLPSIRRRGCVFDDA